MFAQPPHTAAVALVDGSAMRPMIPVVATVFAARRSVPGGTRSAARNGSPILTSIVRRGNGMGSFRPFGQTVSELLTPIGTIMAPVRRASVAAPSFATWSAPVGLRVPSGKTISTYPASRIRVARR
jgi:hypothetical protein